MPQPSLITIWFETICIWGGGRARYCAGRAENGNKCYLYSNTFTKWKPRHHFEERPVLTCVWMQSMGFPTYCLVVTITENVSRITDDMHLHKWWGSRKYIIVFLNFCDAAYQCSLKTELSMWMWETLIKVFSRRNMSSMVLFLDQIVMFSRLWRICDYFDDTLIRAAGVMSTLDAGEMAAPVGRAPRWQVIKICAVDIWAKMRQI